MNRETIATWHTENGKVTLTFCDYLSLAVWNNGRLAGCNLSVKKAQEIVNGLVGEVVWGD